MSEISWGKGRGSSGLFKPGFDSSGSTSLRTSGWARPPCASLPPTAPHSGPTWPRSSTDGLRTCWDGMSFPLWGALYQRWSNLSPAEGPRPRARQRQRQRHRWRLHGKRTSCRPQRPLPLKTSVRPQRPLHPKRTPWRRLKDGNGKAAQAASAVTGH